MKYLKFFRNKILLILLLIALIASSGCYMFDLQITTSGLPDGIDGAWYDAKIYANQYVDYWRISSGTLPGGIGFSNGRFSGTPTLTNHTQSETFNFTVEAVQYGPGGGDHAYKGFSITINPRSN